MDSQSITFCEVWCLLLTLAAVCAGEGWPSVVCDQKPTTHAVQGNCILCSKGRCVLLVVWPCAYKESTNFPESLQPLWIFRGQKSAIKQVPYQRSTNTGHHWTKFSWHYNLVPRICAPLPMTKPSNISFNCSQLLKYPDITLLSIYGTYLLQILLYVPSRGKSEPAHATKEYGVTG